ncbi:hypothetical protein C465_02021 [Halorubrum distributum JCM 9100]|uniref:Uncharacterized protein n=2 Tax=Halorubrum distributum TaxID=29283 RepID=M0EZ49_9EURY|nr:hypothetical protein C465_02021 [Halorubrum distributum JCM 9100]ELZ58884.1 hypothetical protein C466_00385 [Halorubrum distributum JCM 10118]
MIETTLYLREEHIQRDRSICAFERDVLNQRQVILWMRLLAEVVEKSCLKREIRENIAVHRGDDTIVAPAFEEVGCV